MPDNSPTGVYSAYSCSQSLHLMQALEMLERPEPFSLEAWAARRKAAAGSDPTSPSKSSLGDQGQASAEQESAAVQHNIADIKGSTLTTDTTAVAAEDCCSQAEPAFVRDAQAQILLEAARVLAADTSPSSLPVFLPRVENAALRIVDAVKARSSGSGGKENTGCSSTGQAEAATAGPPNFAGGLQQPAAVRTAKTGVGGISACFGAAGPAGGQAGGAGNAAEFSSLPDRADTGRGEKEVKGHNSEFSGHWRGVRRPDGHSSGDAESNAQEACFGAAHEVEAAEGMGLEQMHASINDCKHRQRVRMKQEWTAVRGPAEGTVFWRRKRQKKGGVLDLWNRAAQRK